MAAELSAGAGLTRLADQLQLLSELTETLTVRLLELEEKVAAVDQGLQPLLAQQRSAEASELAADTLLRLDDTEERLMRLEGLLSGLRTTAAGEPAEEYAADPHFPEEDVEQSFLDEPGLFGADAIEAVSDDQESLIDERLIA